MEHILISSSARRTEACAALDNEPLFFLGPESSYFIFAKKPKERSSTRRIHLGGNYSQ